MNDESNATITYAGTGLQAFPGLAQTILKINVPITVTLASKKQTVEQISQLVPGSIIQFDKSCDEMLELSVANQPIAVGEAVKVYDNFGLRITAFYDAGHQLQVLRPDHSGP